LILDEDQNKMKAEDVFLTVEQAVMVHEQTKPYKVEVVMVAVVVLQLLLFLVLERKQVIFDYTNRLITICEINLPIFSTSISREVTRFGRRTGNGGEKQ
jgi:hypothetical protein